jgi:hypothetical protein
VGDKGFHVIDYGSQNSRQVQGNILGKRVMDSGGDVDVIMGLK